MFNNILLTVFLSLLSIVKCFIAVDTHYNLTNIGENKSITADSITFTVHFGFVHTDSRAV